jgi:adenylosuccinate lyase
MPLNSISPIDGRYEKYAKDLASYFSERALMRYRLVVEGEYLIALSQVRGIGMRKLTRKEQKFIRNLYNLKEKDAQTISDIEIKGYKSIKATDHDVKAVEYYLKDKFSRTSLRDVSEWLHFAITSEDTNNLAYALMLSDSLEKVIVPKLRKSQKI